MKTEKKPDEVTTLIEITPQVEMAIEDGFIRVWCPGREIRIGPLTEHQVSVLEDDIGYALSQALSQEENCDERDERRA